MGVHGGGGRVLDPGAGSVDLLGVGLDGSITLVECKLKKNPEIRREVVGQVLAYAGGLWRTSYEDFAARYASRAGMSLIEHLQQTTEQVVEDEDALRAALHERLRSGAFRLVIAVDEITDELKFVVEWLNGHTAAGVQVIALEAEYVKDAGVEVLVPRFYGETVKKDGPVVVKQTEGDMVAAIEALRDPAVRQVFSACCSRARQGASQRTGNRGHVVLVRHGRHPHVDLGDVAEAAAGASRESEHRFRAQQEPAAGGGLPRDSAAGAGTRPLPVPAGPASDEQVPQRPRRRRADAAWCAAAPP